MDKKVEIDPHLFPNSEAKKKWCEEWDYWRGYFKGVKPKNKTFIIVPQAYEKNAEKG